MKILCCGGAGYVGTSLIPTLVDHGYDVTVADLCWFGEPSFPKEVTFIKKDLFEFKQENLEGYDQIIYIAGLSNDPMAEFDSVRNFIYNAALPSYLAYLAKRAKVKRYIYASTASVYGYTTNELYNEESRISCNYPYGVSKLQGEKGAMHLQDDTFSVICLRKGTISGYSPRMRMDLIVNTMFKNAMVNGIITVNNPSIWRPILSVKDAVSAYLRSIQADYSISGVFNIAHDNYTVGEVAQTVKDVIETEFNEKNKKVKLDIKNIQDFRNYKITIDKARTTLGFHPKYSVKDIVVDLIYNCWNKIKDEINDDKYYNINVCKKIFKNKVTLC